MNKSKKIISFMLSVSFMLSTMIGCSSKVENEVKNEDVVERVKITYWDDSCQNMLPDSFTEQLIESVLPVDIVVNRTNNTMMSYVTKLLTESGMPDVMWYNAENQYILDLGITRTIPYDMVEKYAPSFLELYEDNPSILTTIMDVNNQDEFLSLTGTTDQATRVACSQYADYYRYDWILNLGIDLGVEVTQLSDNIYVADNGLTLDKFEEVMDAFTNSDPDGNGIDDTYGASFESMTRFALLYSGFGFIDGVNNSNGEPEMYYALDEYKDFVIWFSDLFSKGYFDNNFFYQDRIQRWDNVNNELCGYFLESSIAINSWASDRPPLTLINSDPDAKFLITPGLSDNNGQGTIAKSEMPTNGFLCYINKNVDDEKLALILQALEYMNFGDEKLSMWFGEEGIDWKLNDDGIVEELNVLSIGDKGNITFVKNVQTGVLFEAVTMQPVFTAGSEFWLDDCIWRENDREQYQYKIDLLKETDYTNLYVTYNESIIEIVLKFFEDCVYNGLDADENWDEYLLKLDEAGYNKMMAELDKVQPLEEMILDYIK